MLAERLRRRGTACWLLNTGWSGGPYGVGKRMRISLTRRLLRAALDGELEGVAFTPDPVFKVLVPDSCPDVADELLKPRSTWSDGAAYDAQARLLAERFAENFARYRPRCPPPWPLPGRWASAETTARPRAVRPAAGPERHLLFVSAIWETLQIVWKGGPMCYGYKGYSDLWWEDAEERRRLEVDRRRQESE